MVKGQNRMPTLHIDFTMPNTQYSTYKLKSSAIGLQAVQTQYSVDQICNTHYVITNSISEYSIHNTQIVKTQ